MMFDIQIKKSFSNFDLDVTFKINEIGITALYGDSGAGKSSIINIIAGLINPDKGYIKIGSNILYDSENKINLPTEQRNMGYIFQEGRLFPHLTVQANLKYGHTNNSRNRSYINFDNVVDVLGIKHLLSRRPAKLSGGEKQRVAIGRALMTNPKFLLMDEPLASLDPSRKSDLLSFILDLHEKFSIPVLYVTHSKNEILRLADKVVWLDNGQVISVGNVEDVINMQGRLNSLNINDKASIISAQIASVNQEDGLTKLFFSGRVMTLSRTDLSIGAKVRVAITASDVILSLDQPANTSIQNIFEGKIKEIVPDEKFMVYLHIDIGTLIWAKITAKALKDMKLIIDMNIYILIKVAVVTRESYKFHN